VVAVLMLGCSEEEEERILWKKKENGRICGKRSNQTV